jgi:hypothetical protein
MLDLTKTQGLRIGLWYYLYMYTRRCRFSKFEELVLALHQQFSETSFNPKLVFSELSQGTLNPKPPVLLRVLSQNLLVL